MVVQPEGSGPVVFLRIQILGDGVASQPAHPQGGDHGLAQGGHGMFLQQSEYTDIFPGSFGPALAFEPAPEKLQALRQLPSRKGAGKVQSARFFLQQGQVVHRLESDLLFVPQTPVPATCSPPQKIVTCRQDPSGESVLVLKRSTYRTGFIKAFTVYGGDEFQARNEIAVRPWFSV